MILIEAGEPVRDDLRIGGGMILPRFQRRIFLARFDRDNPVAESCEMDGFFEIAGMGDWVKIQGCCLFLGCIRRKESASLSYRS